MRTSANYLPTEGGKQYKYLYRQMWQEDTIRRAYKKLRKGKTKRAEIRYIDAHLDEEVAAMQRMILNTRPPGVPVQNPELAFVPSLKEPVMLYEGGKLRKIYVPEIHEQWLHHIIVLVLEPIITGSSYRLSCGSMPKRGGHYGKKAVEKWIRGNPKLCRYFGKGDIRHFYDSVRLDVLLRELRVHIKDEWFLYIIWLCLKDFKRGVPLGYYISQWLANYLLEPLDRMIVKELGVGLYPRYADDIVLIGPNKKTIRRVMEKARIMLGRRFRLKMKRNWTVAKFDYEKKTGKHIGRDIDFMGFRFFRNKTTIRKSIMVRATREAGRIGRRTEEGKPIYVKHAAAMLSYLGWFDATNSYGCYLKRVKPQVKIKAMKHIVSKNQGRLNEHDKLEERTLRQCA